MIIITYCFQCYLSAATARVCANYVCSSQVECSTRVNITLLTYAYMYINAQISEFHRTLGNETKSFVGTPNAIPFFVSFSLPRVWAIPIRHLFHFFGVMQISCQFGVLLYYEQTREELHFLFSRSRKRNWVLYYEMKNYVVNFRLSNFSANKSWKFVCAVDNIVLYADWLLLTVADTATTRRCWPLSLLLLL